MTPGGLGTVDAALIALLITFGLPEEQALAANLVWRAASFIPQVSVGVLTFVYWRWEMARAARRALPPEVAAHADRAGRTLASGLWT